MTELNYPDQREATRLRRWLNTAGAHERLITVVCPSVQHRRAVLGEIVGGGSMKLVELDISSGAVLPDVFREHQGSHTSLTLFSFDGLAERVASEGRTAIDALERDRALFERPATWALFWLADPALVPVLDELAPGFSNAVQLRPTITGSYLEGVESSPSLAELMTTVARGSKRTTLDVEASGRHLVERSDPRGLARLLKERALDATPYLGLRGAMHELSGDPHRALACYWAAMNAPDGARAEELAAAADLSLQLGDRDGAKAAATRALQQTPTSEASIRARSVLRGLAAGGGKTGSDDLIDIAGNDPRLLRAVARTMDQFGDDTEAVKSTLRRAIEEAQNDPTLANEIETNLALLLAIGDSAGHAEARLRLQRLTEAPGICRVRAHRGLAVLAVHQAVEKFEAGDETGASNDLEAAGEMAREARSMAETEGFPGEELNCRWGEVTTLAARQDLDAILSHLTELRDAARHHELRREEFSALERLAHAKRYAGELALASGHLDELESLALDLAWPDLEIRAYAARAEHLAQLEIHGEARAYAERGAVIADAIGATLRAAELREEYASSDDDEH